MDAFSDASVSTVVAMCSAQVGKTEILLNVTGFHIDQDPSSMLIIQPTIEMGEAWSKERLAPMLRDTPCLHGKVKDPRARDSGNQIRHKVFPGGHLAIAGANSPASLASRPLRIALFDEVDRFPPSAGTEGDPVTMGRKRTTNFWNRKIGLFSTPGVAGASRIEKAYSDSDQRRYWVPCPDCGEFQTLKWAQVKWENGNPETAVYTCLGCQSSWGDARRRKAVQMGEWRPDAEFKGIAGFHINELSSPWVKLSETVRGFLEAKDRPEMLKTWVNTSLGETWKEKGQAPEWKRLYGRREQYELVPPGALFLTAFTDVQQDRLEVEVKAWGRNKENWSICYEVIQPQRQDSNGRPIPTRTSEPEPWEVLAGLLRTEWDCEGGGTMQIWCMGIDTGYSPQNVYDFCRRFPQPTHGPMGSRVSSYRSVVPTKGGHSQFKLIENVSDADAAAKRSGLKIVWIGTHNAKQEIYDSLRLERFDDGGFPPGYCHHPRSYNEQYFRGLCAETRIVKANGEIEWRKDEPRNEPLDLHVGNRAAAELCGISRFRDEEWRELERRRNESGHAAPLPDQKLEPSPAAVAQAWHNADAASGSQQVRQNAARPFRPIRGSFL